MTVCRAVIDATLPDPPDLSEGAACQELPRWDAGTLPWMAVPVSRMLLFRLHVPLSGVRPLRRRA